MSYTSGTDHAMRVAFDTNILVYADAGDRTEQDEGKWLVVLDCISAHVAAGDRLFVPAQVLLELFDVLCRKAALGRNEASARVASWRDAMDIVPTNEAVLDAAMMLATQHGLRIFEAIILAAAAQAGCDALYTEDMQHGFTWNGVRVVNPFL